MNNQAAWKGLDPSRTPVFISYDRAELMLAALLEQAARWQPDQVVGVARGGIVPASMAAGILGLGLAFVGYDRARRAVLGEEVAGKRLLVVDDGCSSGGTLHDVRQALARPDRECLTLAIVHDPDTAQHVPDLSHPMRDLWRFPWERGEATPAGRALRATGAGPDRATESPFTGIDPVALANGYVHPNDRSVILPPAGKAAAATALGCTHLVECDAAQAAMISAEAPHLLVTWWSAREQRGYSLAASAHVSAAGGCSSRQAEIRQTPSAPRSMR